MNANNIKNFHTVVELKSLVAAADYLHISQPALSKSIKNLETEIGCPLFVHAKNKMQLNENGQRYYNFTKEYFSRHQKLVQELREGSGINSPNLNISFSSAGNIIPLLIHDFKLQHPHSNFTLKTNVPNIIDTNSHFTFLAARELITAPHYSLLFKEPLYLTLSPENPLARRQYVRLSQLTQEVFLSPGKSNDMFAIQRYYCQLAGFTPQMDNVIEKNNVLLTLISLNMGVALMPQLRHTAFDYQQIMQLPISDIPCYRYIYIVENENVYQTQLAQSFKRFCLAYDYSQINK